MLVLARTIAPASRRRLTTGASAFGTKPFSAGVPALLGRPATWMLSFTTMGTPASGRQRAAAGALSMARAAAAAPDSSSVMIALRALAALARSMAAATSCSLLVLPLQTEPADSARLGSSAAVAAPAHSRQAAYKPIRYVFIVALLAMTGRDCVQRVSQSSCRRNRRHAGLLLEAARGVAIVLVSSGEREWGQ